MKIIDIPEAVKMQTHLDDGSSVETTHEFLDVLESALDIYEPLGKGYKNIMKAVEICARIKKTKKDEEPVLRLENEQYETIKTAMEAGAWKPRFARTIIPFYEAINNAQEVDESGKPKKKDKE